MTLRGQRAFKGGQVGQRSKEGFSFPAPQVQGRRLVGPPGPREQDGVLGGRGRVSTLHGRTPKWASWEDGGVSGQSQHGLWASRSPWPQGAKASDW